MHSLTSLKLSIGFSLRLVFHSQPLLLYIRGYGHCWLGILHLVCLALTFASLYIALTSQAESSMELLRTHGMCIPPVSKSECVNNLCECFIRMLLHYTRNHRRPLPTVLILEWTNNTLSSL